MKTIKKKEQSTIKGGQDNYPSVIICPKCLRPDASCICGISGGSH